MWVADHSHPHRQHTLNSVGASCRHGVTVAASQCDVTTRGGGSQGDVVRTQGPVSLQMTFVDPDLFTPRCRRIMQISTRRASGFDILISSNPAISCSWVGEERPISTVRRRSRPRRETQVAKCTGTQSIGLGPSVRSPGKAQTISVSGPLGQLESDRESLATPHREHRAGRVVATAETLDACEASGRARARLDVRDRGVGRRELHHR